MGNEATVLVVELVREEGAERGLYGVKVTGGGAGGTVAILAHKDAEKAVQRVVRRYAEIRRMDPYIFDGSSMGADRFGVVVQKVDAWRR